MRYKYKIDAHSVPLSLNTSDSDNFQTSWILHFIFKNYFLETSGKPNEMCIGEKKGSFFSGFLRRGFVSGLNWWRQNEADRRHKEMVSQVRKLSWRKQNQSLKACLFRGLWDLVTFLRQGWEQRENYPRVFLFPGSTVLNIYDWFINRWGGWHFPELVNEESRSGWVLRVIKDHTCQGQTCSKYANSDNIPDEVDTIPVLIRL